MPTNRRIERELADLRKEVAGLRTDYARLKRRGADTMSDGTNRYAMISQGLGDVMETIKDGVGEHARSTVEDVTERLNEIRDMANDYSERVEKTVTAHPFAAVAGAAVVGYLIARLNR